MGLLGDSQCGNAHSDFVPRDVSLMASQPCRNSQRGTEHLGSAGKWQDVSESFPEPRDLRRAPFSLLTPLLTHHWRFLAVKDVPPSLAVVAVPSCVCLASRDSCLINQPVSLPHCGNRFFLHSLPSDSWRRWWLPEPGKWDTETDAPGLCFWVVLLAAVPEHGCQGLIPEAKSSQILN